MRKAIAGLLIFFVGGTWAWGTTLLRMDLDDLTQESHAVVHAKIAAQRTEWNAGRTLILTVYTVQPIEYLKGSLGPGFEFSEPGGELDGLSLTVPGAPRFTVGEEAVLFVWTSPQGQNQVTGFEQGALEVETDPQTGLKTVDRAIRLGSARTPAAPGVGAPVTSQFLPQLFQQIRSSAAKTRPAGTTQ